MERLKLSSMIGIVSGFLVIIIIAQVSRDNSPSSQERDFFSQTRCSNFESYFTHPSKRRDHHEPTPFPLPQKAPLRQGTSQDDPALATYIRSLMVPPSMLPYNLTKPRQEHFSQLGQTQFLMNKILPNMTNGFFVEVGAVDGEHLSNTLFLERRMGWRGLLIEAFPQSYEELLRKHRKAYSLQAALSLTKESSKVAFQVRGRKGDLSSFFKDKITKSQEIFVQAFPLYAILKAIDVPVIDYFSLDIEGAELEVLATVPWDKVKVRVMNIEFNHLKGGVRALVPLMATRGLHFIGARSIDAWFVCSELYSQTMKNIS